MRTIFFLLAAASVLTSCATWPQPSGYRIDPMAAYLLLQQRPVQSGFSVPPLPAITLPERRAPVYRFTVPAGGAYYHWAY